jgi:ATP-dependent Lon protease
MTTNFQVSEPTQLPLLPLRDVVVFPHMVIPLFVGRPKSIKALEAAMEQGKSIMLAAQKAAAKDEPSPEDIYEIGCIANILQMLKLPDGTVKVLVEGAQRARIHQITEIDTHFVADLSPVESESGDESEVEAMRRAIVQQFDQYVKLNKKIPPEILTSLAGIDDAGRLADTIAAHLPLKLEQKQVILEIFNVAKRHEHLLGQLESELDILQVEKRIRGRVKRQMEKSQREYYLNEQVKAIQKELGEGEEGADLEDLDKKIIAAKMPKEAREKAQNELKKLKLMSPMSAEATVVRNYIDVLIGLPWKKKSKVNNDLKHAEKVLEDDHYGLDKIKERILEYLAVQQRVEKVKAPILCFVGPPGVGKSYGVEKQLEHSGLFDKLSGRRVKYEVIKGAMTPIGLYCTLYKHSDKNNVIVFDDCDSVFQDDLSLNILKAALDSGKKRRIYWNSDSAMLRREGVPDMFDFKGSCIFITNLQFQNLKSKKLQDHLEALQSRCHFIDFSLNNMRDSFLRIKQIYLKGELFADYDFTQEQGDEVINFMEANQNRLREISLRMALKIADLTKVSGDNWKALAATTCMKNS